MTTPTPTPQPHDCPHVADLEMGLAAQLAVLTQLEARVVALETRLSAVGRLLARMGRPWGSP